MKQQGMESCSWRARHFKVLFVLSVLLKLVPSSFAIMDEASYNKYLSHYIGENQDVAAEVHSSPFMDETSFENYLSHYIGKNQDSALEKCAEVSIVSCQIQNDKLGFIDCDNFASVEARIDTPKNCERSITVKSKVQNILNTPITGKYSIDDVPTSPAYKLVVGNSAEYTTIKTVNVCEMTGNSFELVRFNARSIWVDDQDDAQKCEEENLSLPLILPTNSPSAHPTVSPTADSYWAQVGQLINEECGGNVIDISKDGTMVIVGCPFLNKGLVTIYRFSRENRRWEKVGINYEGNGSNQFTYAGISVAFAPNANVYAIAEVVDGPGRFKVYEFTDSSASSYRQLGNVINGDNNNSFNPNVALSGDGRRIAISKPSKTGGVVEIFDLIDSEWKSKRRFERTTQPFFGQTISLSEDGESIGISTKNGDVEIFEVGSKNSPAVVSGSSDAVAISGNGKVAAVASAADGKLTIFSIGNINTGLVLRVIDTVKIGKRGQSDNFEAVVDLDFNGTTAVYASGVEGEVLSSLNMWNNWMTETSFRMGQDITSVAVARSGLSVARVGGGSSIIEPIAPSNAPSFSTSPSVLPTSSTSPSGKPSNQPSGDRVPSGSPSSFPSLSPSNSPSSSPFELPSLSPVIQPSNSPSQSISPSELPSESPSMLPSESPSPTSIVIGGKGKGGKGKKGKKKGKGIKSPSASKGKGISAPSAIGKGKGTKSPSGVGKGKKSNGKGKKKCKKSKGKKKYNAKDCDEINDDGNRCNVPPDSKTAKVSFEVNERVVDSDIGLEPLNAILCKANVRKLRALQQNNVTIESIYVASLAKQGDIECDPGCYYKAEGIAYYTGDEITLLDTSRYLKTKLDPSDFKFVSNTVIIEENESIGGSDVSASTMKGYSNGSRMFIYVLATVIPLVVIGSVLFFVQRHKKQKKALWDKDEYDKPDYYGNDLNGDVHIRKMNSRLSTRKKLVLKPTPLNTSTPRTITPRTVTPGSTASSMSMNMNTFPIKSGTNSSHRSSTKYTQLNCENGTTATSFFPIKSLDRKNNKNNTNANTNTNMNINTNNRTVTNDNIFSNDMEQNESYDMNQNESYDMNQNINTMDNQMTPFDEAPAVSTGLKVRSPLSVKLAHGGGTRTDPTTLMSSSSSSSSPSASSKYYYHAKKKTFQKGWNLDFDTTSNYFDDHRDHHNEDNIDL